MAGIATLLKLLIVQLEDLNINTVADDGSGSPLQQPVTPGQARCNNRQYTHQVLRLLDPCAGRGSAAIFLARLLCLQAKAKSLQEANQSSWLVKSPEQPAAAGIANSKWLELFGIELDAERGRVAAPHFTRFIRSNALSAKVQDNGFDLLFHNPPYHTDDQEKRLEHAFLKKFTPTLKPGGILVHIVPQNRLEISAEWLAHRFEGIQVWRFPDPFYRAFKQVVLIGVKREQACADGDTVRRLREYAKGDPDCLPCLPCPADRDVVALIKATGLPITPELFDEFEDAEKKQLRTLQEGKLDCQHGLLAEETPINLELDKMLLGDLRIAQPYVMRPTLERSGPRQPQNNNNSYDTFNTLLFQSGEYNREAALREARLSGVWSNRVLRDLVDDTHGVATNGDGHKMRPLTPLREGQAVQLVVNGLLNNMVLEENECSSAVAASTAVEVGNSSTTPPKFR